MYCSIHLKICKGFLNINVEIIMLFFGKIFFRLVINKYLKDKEIVWSANYFNQKNKVKVC